MGFRADPQEKLDSLTKELNSFLQLFSTNPIFGVDYTVEADQPVALPSAAPIRVEEDVEVLEETEDTHALAAYFVDGCDETDIQAGDAINKSNINANIQFDTKLGLAVEATSGDFTLESLWRVI